MSDKPHLWRTHGIWWCSAIAAPPMQRTPGTELRVFQRCREAVMALAADRKSGFTPAMAYDCWEYFHRWPSFWTRQILSPSSTPPAAPSVSALSRLKHLLRLGRCESQRTPITVHRNR